MVHRCSSCSILYVEEEIEQGVCPSCGVPLGSAPGSPQLDDPTPARTDTPVPRRAVSFLLGMFVGGLIGAAALWAALRPSTPVADGENEQTSTSQAEQAPKTEADNEPRKTEADRQAAQLAHAEAVKALDAARQQASALSKQKDDAEQRLREAQATLAEERTRRAALEKALAQEKKPHPEPTRSFVRDWQLLGPFVSAAEQGHDTTYPPEREPVQPQKAYNGFGGLVKWRPYHSVEDKIDLAGLYSYWKPGTAFGVTWVFSDADQPVTLGVGSDDGVRLWVNGAKVHDVKGGRQARPGQDAVKVRLKKGWNEVLAKVDNIIGTWELYLEFRSADGGQPLKLFSTSAVPPAAAR